MQTFYFGTLSRGELIEEGGARKLSQCRASTEESWKKWRNDLRWRKSISETRYQKRGKARHRTLEEEWRIKGGEIRERTEIKDKFRGSSTQDNLVMYGKWSPMHLSSKFRWYQFYSARAVLFCRAISNSERSRDSDSLVTGFASTRESLMRSTSWAPAICEEKTWMMCFGAQEEILDEIRQLIADVSILLRELDYRGILLWTLWFLGICQE
jgi:hypothetical protein